MPRLPFIPLILALAALPALAGPQENRVARFAWLDKITGDISRFALRLNETKRLGHLSITVRACHTRPPTEKPKTMAFVEIDEHGIDGGASRIFSGWMNAESPGLNALEHPIHDVWLTGCAEPLETHGQ